MDACSPLVLLATTAVAFCGVSATIPEHTQVLTIGPDSEDVTLTQRVLLLGFFSFPWTTLIITAI